MASCIYCVSCVLLYFPISLWVLVLLVFVLAAFRSCGSSSPSGPGAHRTAGRGQLVTDCRQLLPCVGTGSQVMGCVSWYPIIEGWPPACSAPLSSGKPGCVYGIRYYFRSTYPPPGVAEKRAGLRETGEIYATHPLHASLGFSCVSRQGGSRKGADPISISACQK